MLAVETLTDQLRDNLSKPMVDELAPLATDSVRYLAKFDELHKGARARFGEYGSQMMSNVLLESTREAFQDAEPPGWLIAKMVEINDQLPEIPDHELADFRIETSSRKELRASTAFQEAADAYQEEDFVLARKHIEACKRFALEDGVAVPNAARMLEVRLDIRDDNITESNLVEKTELPVEDVLDIRNKIRGALALGMDSGWDLARDLMLAVGELSGNDTSIKYYTVAVFEVMKGNSN